MLKLNRSYGGGRIIIGPSTSPAAWESALQAAVGSGDNGEEHWVLQRLAPTKYGLAILGRASQKQVVNVAQRDGMCGVLIGQPAGRLHGPAVPILPSG